MSAGMAPEVRALRLGNVDLATLPAPDALETVDWLTIVGQIKGALVERYPECADVIDDELEPLVYLCRNFANREMQLRATWNDKVRRVLLASATGTGLDALGAKFGCERMVVQEADPTASPPRELIMESDARYRTRIQYAPSAFSTAGSREAYIYQAMTADPRIISVQAYNHASGVGLSPGQVAVVTLTDSPDDDASAAQNVRVRLARADIAPLTVDTAVVSAVRYPVDVSAVQHVLYGPSRIPVLTAGRANVSAYFNSRKAVARKLARSGLEGALHTAGVEWVSLSRPVQDFDPGPWGVVVPGVMDITSEAVNG